MSLVLANRKNEAQLVEYAKSIHKNMREWQLITVRLINPGDDIEDVTQKLLATYWENDGMLFKMDERKIVLMIRLGKVANHNTLQREIESSIPDNRCRVLARKMTKSGMQQVTIDFTGGKNTREEDFYETRKGRNEDVLLVVDDDIFVRQAFATSLENLCTVHEAENPNDVVEAYRAYNPDVVFLDIHMPGKTGLELIEEILSIDMDAYIVLISSDSVRENVLEAMERGAVGFLSKPPKMDKVLHYLRQCPTIKKKVAA